jgi:hypothetical protein
MSELRPATAGLEVLSGRILHYAYPRAKAWAVLYSRSTAKSD